MAWTAGYSNIADSGSAGSGVLYWSVCVVEIGQFYLYIWHGKVYIKEIYSKIEILRRLLI